MKEINEQVEVLAHAMQLFEQIGEFLPFGIMISNPDGIVHYSNNIFSTWLPDYSPISKLWYLQMQPYLDIEYSPLNKPFHPSNDELEDILASNQTNIVVNWQNQRVFFRIKTKALYNDKQQVCGLIEVTENVTEFKHLEFSLQQSRRFETVGRLASGIAHDFNNILQVINGHSEMLLELYQDNAKLQKSLDVILTSGQKASALTRQLLLFSRRQQNEFKLLNIGSMINSMQKIISRMLGEDIIMDMYCNDTNLYIEGDESQIEQIIMNLAINARDAMPEGGKINIQVGSREFLQSDYLSTPYSKPGSFVCLSFSDTGIGMSNDIIEHIFEPFFTTKETGRGTGLGLATVYSIVKQHQGFILVDSKVGIGTTFNIHFPLCKLKKDADELIEACTPSNGGMESVLIIEDDELVRDLASQVLLNYGYNVQYAPNLTTAYQIMQVSCFDLFLIDIVLPDGNGVDFIERMKDLHPKAAFILSSGYTEDKPQIKNTLRKGYTFLHKPYTINALLTACKEALAAKRV